jgi:arsenate reductase-like glutaredoxin family protein
MPDDPMQRPISRELEILFPVLAETMKYATQALAQSTAVYEILISKKIATRAELEGAMSSTQKMRESLMAKLDEQIKKQS